MEIWDLYDGDRRLTGETLERGRPVPEGRYHVVVHVAVFDRAGRMLIQQRQSFKEGWPGLWDVTAAGSALAGESSAQAARRELLEEVGLSVDFEGVRPKVIFPRENCFSDVYTVTMEAQPDSLTLQPEEVQAVRWATEAELLAMLDEGAFVPYHRSYIELLFRLRSQRGVHQP